MLKISEIRNLFNQEEDVGYGSPVHQESVFVIMWQSTKSGGTYTTLRKSIQGKNRFLNGLQMLGVDLREVEVVEQKKIWIPIKKSEQKPNYSSREHGKSWQSGKRTTRQRKMR